MTGRERLVGAARGGELDRKPVIVWGSFLETADACVVPLDQLFTSDHAACLVSVDSPFTRAMRSGLDLNAELYNEPETGNERLDHLVNSTEMEIATALERGADGICYVLDGAYPAKSTPMQYGGYYLERDREILEKFTEARFNLVWIEGEDEVYLDSVSDLPADCLGWRIEESQFSLGQMRDLRPGALAGFVDEADIRLVSSTDPLEQLFERLRMAEVSA